MNRRLETSFCPVQHMIGQRLFWCEGEQGFAAAGAEVAVKRREFAQQHMIDEWHPHLDAVGHTGEVRVPQ